MLFRSFCPGKPRPDGGADPLPNDQDMYYGWWSDKVACPDVPPSSGSDLSQKEFKVAENDCWAFSPPSLVDMDNQTSGETQSSDDNQTVTEGLLQPTDENGTQTVSESRRLLQTQQQQQHVPEGYHGDTHILCSEGYYCPGDGQMYPCPSLYGLAQSPGQPGSFSKAGASRAEQCGCPPNKIGRAHV